jgi:hypothetical protein
MFGAAVVNSISDQVETGRSEHIAESEPVGLRSASIGSRILVAPSAQDAAPPPAGGGTDRRWAVNRRTKMPPIGLQI